MKSHHFFLFFIFALIGNLTAKQPQVDNPPQVTVQGVLDSSKMMLEPKIIKSTPGPNDKATFEDNILTQIRKTVFFWAEPGAKLTVTVSQLQGKFEQSFIISTNGSADAEFDFKTGRRSFPTFIPLTANIPWKSASDANFTLVPTKPHKPTKVNTPVTDDQILSVDLQKTYTILAIKFSEKNLLAIDVQFAANDKS